MKEFFQRSMDSALDLIMSGMMNGIQARHHLPPGSRAALEKYVTDGEAMTPEQFYAFSPTDIAITNEGATLHWTSPIDTGFAKSNVTHVDLYPCDKRWTAPTVLMLHALMSTSDEGYKRWAKHFNDRGWNACFLHLPYHYSRVPGGYFNGELAVGPDLVRTGQGLRQGVVELRQLMHYLRAQGCPGFGLWATSYGGWIGALLSFVERDLRFMALMSPIVSVNHAIWESTASYWLRYQLRKHGITHSTVERYNHLISPMHNTPLCGSDRVIFSTGLHDLTVLPKDVKQIHEIWAGSELRLLPQGHFGYRIMPDMLERLTERGLFD